MTADQSNVSVIWVTNVTATDSTVCYRPKGAQLNFSCVAGTSWTYTPISVWPWYGTIHGAYMTSLEAGESYEYFVGDSVIGAWSATTDFIAPNLDDSQRELFVAFGGDMGTVQLFGHAIAKQMHEDFNNRSFSPNPFDAFWLIGDIAYSTLDPPKLNFEFFWDMFFRQEAPLVQHIPFLVSFGNHDFSGGDAGAYINRYRMPQQTGRSEGLGNFYWSYEHGPVKYVSMCTEVGLEKNLCNYAPGSAQYKWLQHEFATINRTKTPWLILAGHRPMYSSDRDTDSGPLQMYIEPLIIKYKVDLELSGHMHCTEVSAPVNNNVPNMTGVTINGPTSFVYSQPSLPVHITAGTLGALIREKFFEPAPAWSMFRNGTFMDNAYGYATLRATQTSLTMKLYRTQTREVMWDLTIEK